MKVAVRFTLEVPDGTDPQRVLDVVNEELDSAADGGGLVQFGNWDYTRAELIGIVGRLAPYTSDGGGGGGEYAFKPPA